MFKTLKTKRYVITESFNAVSVTTNAADIVFAPSDSEKCLVTCREQKNVNHSVEVKDGVLAVEVIDSRRWHDRLGISFKSPRITVYLPGNKYAFLFVKEEVGTVKVPDNFMFGSIDISSQTGDIDLGASAFEKVSVRTGTGEIRVLKTVTKNLELVSSTGGVMADGVTCSEDAVISVSTGKTKLCNIKCRNLISNTKTGDVSLKYITANDKISIIKNTGDVNFDGLCAGEIYVETDTGDVNGSVLSEMVFDAYSDSGSVDVPKTDGGGICRIKVDTGDIKVRIKR